MDKTLFAFTDVTHPYPPYVNASRMADDGRLRILARAPGVNGREGVTAQVMLNPVEALELARSIIAEFDPS